MNDKDPNIKQALVDLQRLASPDAERFSDSDRITAFCKAVFTLERAIEQQKIEADPDERVFILTDSCMWESNKQNGTRAPHAVEVVDEATGQVHYIKSGSQIRFLGGMITKPASQEVYNENKEVEYEPKTNKEIPQRGTQGRERQD